MNPILPIQYFVPDVEARQWNDGRMYLYGSYDISGRTCFCSWEYHVFSSSDLINWEDHGESLRSAPPNAAVPFSTAPLFAPDCIYYKDRYYLFFCTAGNREAVAESFSPIGPFTHATPIEGADGDAIDPAVLVDDDRQVYYYWGQFHLRGAKLRSDLRGIEPETLKTDLLTESADGFHEGASIRKRNGIYYMIFADISRGKPTALGYATSPTPLGPFIKRGIIIDNLGCDPQTWNNHGSMAEFNGQWYIFYHRSSQASMFNRRVCIEPISFNADGSIDEVEMTTQGILGPLQATQQLEAWRACLLSGHVFSTPQDPTEETQVVYERLTQIHSGDWAAYKYLDFGSEHITRFVCRAGSLAYGGVIEIHLDQPDGEIIGECLVPHTGGWQRWATLNCSVTTVKGIHAVYLVFKGIGNKFVIPKFDPERLFDLMSFWFE